MAFNHFDRDESEAVKTAKMLEDQGAVVDYLKFDVSDPAQVSAYMKHLTQSYGSLDVLVNNAGITMDALLLRMTMEQWERVLKVNLTAPFVCTQAAAKIMIRQRRGCIVNMASVSGVLGTAGQANYAASKAGLIALTKTAARELAGRNVRVNAVAPGFIATEMTASLSAEVQEDYLNQIPLKRPGTPRDVAQVVAYLCSDAASYLTGQVLHVSGGLYM
jgi:3-oxoacyl-[acyl-carrier protein] reductase